MKILNNIRKPLPHSLKPWGMLLVLAFMAPLYAQAQILIDGNVYGGGDMGNVGGSSSVKVLSGNIGTDSIDNPGGSVFGGARMADVGGSASVFIDGEHEGATDYVLINRVYGGNDIAGQIGSSESLPEGIDAEDATEDGIDNSWNTFVVITNAKQDGQPSDESGEDIKKTYIGQLFGGGNGNYVYTREGETTYTHTITDTSGDTLTTIVNDQLSVKPVAGKSFVDIHGGSIVYAYGGGNNATITENAVICVENESKIVGSINVDEDGRLAANGDSLITDRRLEAMGINLKFSSPTAESSGDFQIGRLFGGNNLAEMNIRPTWYLEKGSIRNLYSGGNRGDMTHVEGLLLDISSESTIRVDNLFGGCRMANVTPLKPGTRTPALPSEIYLTETDERGNIKYRLPAGMSARVLIYGGDINNVYGGNDITGNVTGGNILAIYSTVRGNIYGGGNGSYAYTDNPLLRNDQEYSDVYYNPDDVLAKYNIDAEGMDAGLKSVTALNLFRPNAEQSSILIMGNPVMQYGPGAPVLLRTDSTIIGGSVFLGGNSATIHSSKDNPLVGIKIGSSAFIDKLFMGNNGEEMINESILTTMSGTLSDNTRFNSIDLTDSLMFARYMEGAAMDMIPSLSTTHTQDGDRFEYEPYSSYIGSLYFGGNVGSMTYPGTNNINLNSEIVIFDKLVGGCNNASVPKTTLNAYYDGGILGSASEQEQDYTLDRISMTLNGIKIEPKRWKMTTPEGDDDEPEYELDAKGRRMLEWNTFKWDDDENVFVAIGTDNSDEDEERRLIGGNVYGGCYTSGHVNGNVNINILKDLTVRDEVFGPENSHVELYDQGEDIMAVTMTTFGAGMGEQTEVWGSTTVNLKDAYAFQIFGGGEMGIVGKGEIQKEGDEWELDEDGFPIKSYAYNPLYSTTVNLRGTNAGYSENESGPVLAEAQYLYGAGNEGSVCGDSYLYLGNGRIYDAFGGASNADILGHAETYIGRQKTESGTFTNGFPWVQDIVFGGNDFGGMIGSGHTGDFRSDSRYRTTQPEMLNSVSTYVEYIQGRVDSLFGGGYGNYNYYDDIYNDYVYTYKDQAGNKLEDHKVGDPKNGFRYPYMYGNSFIFFQPVDNSKNYVGVIFGGSEGSPGVVDLNNTMQEESYLLIDDINTSVENRNNFKNTDIFGGGAFGGMGAKDIDKKTYDVLKLLPGAGRTVIDLWAGRFNDVYGGCNKEGLIGFSRVNVPEESTIHVNSIFGGGKGYDLDQLATDEEKDKYKALYCDHYITFVDFRGADAIVDNAIYGGNNNRRISFDTYVNIAAPVKNSQGQLITVFGAGYGKETTSGRTNVFLQDGAQVNQVYGGGHNGTTYNYPSLVRWLYNEQPGTDPAAKLAGVMKYSGYLDGFHVYIEGKPEASYPAHPINLTDDVLDIIDNVKEENGQKIYVDNGRTTVLEPENLLFNNTPYYNTNVHILEGAQVKGNPRAGGGSDNGYAYGGGLGQDAVIAGSTYIGLKGGYVEKDIYAGGEGGAIMNYYKLRTTSDNNQLFKASSNVYIGGGTVRNVYGGGYNGHVGTHTKTVDDIEVNALISDPYINDLPGETHVVIGKIGGTSYTDGIPSIKRNVYAGGEGGSVYGDTYLTINNGYIGFNHSTGTETVIENEGTENETTTTRTVDVYTENLDEYNAGDNRLDMNGNVFGGGYVASSYVDNSHIEMYGGTIRGSLYGGGEIGPIGRGTKLNVEVVPDFAISNGDATIYKAGQTHVKMFNGHVMRNVFGGGRGHDSWGGEGWKPELETDLSSKGNVFGQTDVCIYGGEIGTEEGVLAGKEIGNVFGGGDVGYVYSAYELADGTLAYGKKSGTRYDDSDEGYYYKWEGGGWKLDNNEKLLTEDCHVLVEPWLEVTDPDGISYEQVNYPKGSYIPAAYLNTLGKKDPDTGVWADADKWAQVDTGAVVDGKYIERGVIIHNAVFAGGNVSAGSELYANTPTVLGNATASIHDIYSRDFVTIGTGHTGGLYGDGNLTLVDGYRGLNITNYGTDYYNIPKEIAYEKYKTIAPREQNYYELKYVCIDQITDNEGTTYQPGAKITQDDLIALFTGTECIQNGKLTDTGRGYWTENGVVSLYAGRIMNTIQRADFCGVFGSRMVMKGAQDRTIETIDHTNYTINRVREVSLNKKKDNGNYFGIYNIVNYLGALTSDVDMDTIRFTDNQKSGYKDEGYGTTTTYYDWKKAHLKDRKGNDGISHNQVALASGVYLELTTEKSTGTGLYEKDWGYITGVVELDLISVSAGVGGGFVYAKNVHGQRLPSGRKNTIIEGLNTGAATNKSWIYIDQVEKENTGEYENLQEKMQTSGNFVHSRQVIIDDCYNKSGKYLVGEEPVPAHYWFIKGQVYVYDQVISAYTGSPKAYPQIADIPLTINAGAYGKIKLINIQPNLYAYYSSYTNESNNVKLEGDRKLAIKDMTFSLNDPISYWDWQLLTPAERQLFKEDTYVVTDSCKITKNSGETVEYPAGYVLLRSEYDALKGSALRTEVYKKSTGYAKPDTVDFTYAVRSSNNLGHDTGYLLTYEVNNPSVWSKWYTPVTGSASNKTQTPTPADQYLSGPTYKPDVSNIYGQRTYQEAEIITMQEYIDYEGEKDNEDLNGDGTIESGLKGSHSSLIEALNNEQATCQAEFERAWIATETIMTDDKYNNTRQLQKGARLVKSDFTDDQWTAIQDKVAEAYVSTRPIQISATEIITDHETMTKAEKESHMGSTSAENNQAINDLLNGIAGMTNDRKKAIIDGAALTDDEQTALGTDGVNSLNSLLSILYIDQSIVPAYYCTKAGLYGGDYYDAGKNYRALHAWSSMSEADRAHFTFNYDALDLLIDPEFRKEDGKKYQYDGYESFDPNTASQDEKDRMIYSMPKPVDYTATYEGSDAANVYFTPDGTDSPTTISAAGKTELTRTEFESILNEQLYYTAITVNEPGNYYIVKKDFVDVHPYVTGQVIDKDDYDNLTSNNYGNNKDYVDILTFGEPGTYYYCREAYTISPTNGHPVKGIQAAPGVTINNAAILAGTEKTTEVPQGFIISKEGDNNMYGYKSLTNQQKDFAIHGTIPVETSTLFVSRNSDILDLSKEKIMTIIYQYDYNDFVDESGENILPVSEYHVINIHIRFESGIPIVDDITDPATVLPGTSLTMREPTVTPGAYDVFGGGWEIFQKETEAQMGINGVEYNPNSDLLYWYQHGYYIAYYAKTYLGKTYSNPKPLSVANYHDLKKIMDDKEHHLYVDYDNSKLKRNSKVYINDYSRSGENGLDLFKDFYDLSVLSSTLTDHDLDHDGLITSDASVRFAGHTPLNSDPENGVIAGNNLEFFLHTNINYTADWEPIGDSECFSGTFHGDGYTISGLNNSLFSDLCGNVYNLGVTGTFTGAGIADAGSGYIENSWISTTSTAAKTTAPVFGNPSRTETQINQLGKIQIVNSYYLEDDNAKTTPASDDATHMVAYTNHPTSSEFGTAIRKPEQSFYNGEVAYDLNSSYLNKRYYDNSGASTENHDPIYGNLDYVTSRYEDGDYRYVGPYGGVIPTEPDLLREYQEDEDSPVQYIPVWPDDYLFFGQDLTFGWDEDKAHQDMPSHYSGGNRVLRAPAYFGDNVMSSIHFNPDVNLTAYTKDKSREAYPYLTAVDMAGHNDIDISNAYRQGTDAATGRFYAPLLDLGINNDGITGIINRDETRNLLVYAPAVQYNVTVTTKNDNDETVTTTNTVNSSTYSILKAYFMDTDGDYADHHSESDPYRSVLKADVSAIRGHLVQSDLTAIHDHLLVDKQDFNAPISYEFTDDHYMWYQRKPDSYVNSQTSGWETVSLPFTVELVTTHQKGELTHFYDYSKQQNVGHEYWLREFRELDATDPSPIVQTQDNDVTLTNIYFSSLKGKSNSSKTTHNTFLWDYYYNNENNANTADRHKDKNKDDYRTYYNFGSNGKTYPSYPYQTAGMPYLIGWPGGRYYEFDLSGSFVPQNTAATGPAALDEAGQVITFVSDKNVSIDVTQSEYDDYATTLGGYTFTPNYQTRTLPGATTYLLNAAGDAFQNNPETVSEPNPTQTTVPFRAYIAKASTGASRRSAAHATAYANMLYIGYAGSSDQLEEMAAQGGLLIYSQDMNICIESTLEYPTEVTIMTVAGKLLKQFTIQPATKVSVPVNSRGVYIVNNQKIAVTK